ncbi:leucyl aminopeptidase family protein [Sphingobium sufflavum]|uniref:leucyl aminopeptidase family protein n=1 Tax=Sphingobium sufflavum TaxID=1129547 RepID=UPI001F221979|nr:leucyl aminopeptidase family protein [Sphingobium sufflavum]MCE7796105.1 leucyl aminopeptidase family protein [Sphingobium sufflavum]
MPHPADRLQIDLLQIDRGQAARDIHLIDAAGYDAWLAAQPARHRAAIEAQGFGPRPFAHAILPGDAPEDWSVVTSVANVDSLSSWCLAKLAEILPEGTYRLADGDAGPALFGWMTDQYRFDRYRKTPSTKGPRILLTRQPHLRDALGAQAQATALVRTLVNTPAEDMGPDALEDVARAIATRHGATIEVVRGDALERDYPMVHAVGRAAGRAHAPRFVELRWGREDHPRVAIVGKGVTFDSGGLDIKPSSGMRLMKKDMGGAAHALALADLLMAGALPVRLHLLLPIAENAVGAHAFRPGDVLTARDGTHVEISNTDAEGRLLLADALIRAGEEQPELIVDFATLTGAARAALGPDLPALFANDDALATALTDAGTAGDDPLWRLPLWPHYEDMLKSDIADMVNSAEGGFGGAITAALFLQRFVPDGVAWAHLDTFAWRPAAKPGRPKGGDALGLRAVAAVLRDRYGRQTL